MISIDQWRAAIGCFNPGRKSSWSTEVIVLRGQPIRTGFRLVLALSLCIVLCGDVETNPGPGIDAVLKELREFRESSDLHFRTLTGEITSLRSDFASLRHDLDTVTEKVKQTTHDLDSMYDECYGDIKSLKYQIGQLEQQIEHQERYSRRENLLFYDLPGEKEESHECTTEKLVKLLNESVSRSDRVWSKDDFVRVHRLKTRKSGTAPVIARFFRPNDKFCVLNSRKQLRDSGVGVSNDLTVSQREELNRLKQEGKRGFFKNGRLQIDHNYRPGNPADTNSSPGNRGPFTATHTQVGNTSRGFPRGSLRRQDSTQNAAGHRNSPDAQSQPPASGNTSVKT